MWSASFRIFFLIQFRRSYRQIDRYVQCSIEVGRSVVCNQLELASRVVYLHSGRHVTMSSYGKSGI